VLLSFQPSQCTHTRLPATHIVYFFPASDVSGWFRLRPFFFSFGREDCATFSVYYRSTLVRATTFNGPHRNLNSWPRAHTGLKILHETMPQKWFDNFKLSARLMDSYCETCLLRRIKSFHPLSIIHNKRTVQTSVKLPDRRQKIVSIVF